MSALVADTLTLLRRELIRYRRDRAYWIGQIVFPLAIVGFIGFGLDAVVALPSGTRYVEHLATGVLALLVGSGAVGGGFSLIEDRESGFLRALLIAPVSRTSIVLGKLVARMLASLVLVGVLVGILAAFTPVRIAHAGALVLAVGGITAIFVGMGVALAARLRRLESFRLIAALVTVPLYLFSGIFYPLSTLPAPTRWISYANPLTYGADLLRYGLLDVHEIGVATSCGMLIVLTAAAVGLAITAFDRGMRT
ncbi:MAG: ABC transporter permease [Myxococcales bacterium]|nr:ABC transporter permease [Myxococcales bacterium]MDH5307350.1 ABC transporter permease [Myxococcales bacterium]